MHDDLDQRIGAVFAKLFRVDAASLTDDVRRGELKGWDSLGQLTLVGELEAQFSVPLDMDHTLAIETFGDAKRVIRELLNS